MAGKKPKLVEKRISPSTLWTMRLLILGAAGVSAYLAWVSWQGAAVAGCGPESGCHKVLHSRWAYWFGMPVSFPALLTYLAVLVGSFGIDPAQPTMRQRKAWACLLTLAWLIICVALWFAFLQLLVVRAFCPYCMVAHGLAGIGAVLLLLNAPYRAAGEKGRQPEREVFISPALSRKLFFLGIAGFVTVLAGQTLYQRPTYQEAPLTVVVTNRLQTHTLELFSGKITLDLTEVPIMGRPDAPHVILGLFDYTCHHCRLMHPELVAAQKLLSNELAIVHLPMPLDERCNPSIRAGGTPREHQQACDYARLGLTIWRADRQRLPEYDDWFFQFQTPPPLPSAEAYARKLVGQAAFEAAVRDPWIGRQLTNDIAIYLTSKQDFQVGNMPQLIVGTNIFGGTMSLNQLLYVLNTRLGMTSAVPIAPYNPLAPSTKSRTQ